MNYKLLFQQQSYIDALVYYENVLKGSPRTVAWDYVILTASNEAQAKSYQEQISYRLTNGYLPRDTHYAVLPDPEGKRVGSGGATFNAIRYVRERAGTLDGVRILVIHSGGDSKRIPQYSACGKLFSPVPRMLPGDRRSTLFDELMIGMSEVASRVTDGMLVCSGDVLLLFNALQIDFCSAEAAAISIKEDVNVGKNHGVFLKDEQGNVGRFLHKQSVEILDQLGAVDAKNCIDIDTGAVILSSTILKDLYSLIDTEERFQSFVNEEARVSFYADFLYPLASKSTLEQFFHEKPEGDFTPQLHNCREKLWNVLHAHSMRLILLSPASFIHFGTTGELLNLVINDLADYRFLGWQRGICTNAISTDYAASNSFVSSDAVVGKGSYIEDSYILSGAEIGEGCVVSGVLLSNVKIPDGTVLHGLKLNDGKYVARLYGVHDNPKVQKLFGIPLQEPLWTAKIYPVRKTMEEAIRATLDTILGGGKKSGEYISLRDSFNQADVTSILPWQLKLKDRIIAEKILHCIETGMWVDTVKEQFPAISKRTQGLLEQIANDFPSDSLDTFRKKIRIYYFLSRLTNNGSHYSDACFSAIRGAILRNAAGTKFNSSHRMTQNEVTVRLPVRVNWGGGWSDTPPYCLEHGGTVFNAAISFAGMLPIEVTVRRVEEPVIILASTDIRSQKVFSEIQELQNCKNPSDNFALHKAALIACGVIPLNEQISVKDICKKLGGGLYINTCVINIPKGSGLGTSSILAGACVKAIYQFFNTDIEENDLYNCVLCMEQLMSTGGGWQDQVGGLAPGMKIVSSKPGLSQKITCTPVNLSAATKSELQARFALIYTGQRRLARNLLREVVGKYIGNNPVAIRVLRDIQGIAFQMRSSLEQGDIDAFARLLNQHWEQSVLLDAGCTNTCINQIFLTIEDLIDGKMICGAGGGGFLQVILKKGVSKEQLQSRLYEVFSDSGVSVWECQFE